MTSSKLLDMSKAGIPVVMVLTGLGMSFSVGQAMAGQDAATSQLAAKVARLEAGREADRLERGQMREAMHRMSVALERLDTTLRERLPAGGR